MILGIFIGFVVTLAAIRSYKYLAAGVLFDSVIDATEKDKR